MLKRIFFIFSLFCFALQFANAQRTAIGDTTNKPGKIIEIIRADRQNFQKVDSFNLISLVGNAIVKQDRTWFYADSIVLNQNTNLLEAFGKVHINDADTVHTYADYLKYLGKEKKAFLQKNVKLTDGKGVLTTEELEYDTQLKIGTYLKGGKLVNKKTILTSKEGYYYGDTKDVYFKKNVYLNDPEYKIKTDTLYYNTNSEVATFVCPTTILNGKRKVETKDGYYDLRNKKGVLRKRPFIDDSTFTFTAEDMAFDDSTGQGEYRGNAVYRSKDTAQGFDIIANNIKTDRKKNIFLATQKPILLIKQSADSVWVKADTLYSARLTDLLKTRAIPTLNDSIKIDTAKLLKADSTNKFFEAFYNVKIFYDSLQVSCDSMFYALSDSVFRLFKNPIVWAKENQLTGDTILLFTKNKKPHQLEIFENAMAISQVQAEYFNQVKGNIINGYFIDGKITYLHTKGNAESVYYAVDEANSLAGVNKSSADVIDIYFDENSDKNTKPKRVAFRNNLKGTMYPMLQINHIDLRLKNFNWQQSKRPKSKFDILIN